MAVEEDVLRGVRDLWRFVVVVDQHFLGCFVCWSHIGCEKGPVHDDTDDLVRAVAESMGELREVMSVVDRKPSKQERPVLREL